MDVTPILENLNDAQRKAVTAQAEPTLVIAGAGSGKTRVLTHRAAWLIDVEQVSPHSLMAVTFTNKAAASRIGCSGATGAKQSCLRAFRSSTPTTSSG